MKAWDFAMVGPLLMDPTVAVGGIVAQGGLYEFFTNFELEQPLIKEAGVKLVGFFDLGNSYAQFPGASLFSTLLSDVGFGIRWFSPIGPLRFEWAFPLTRRAGVATDTGETKFVFFIGQPF